MNRDYGRMRALQALGLKTAFDLDDAKQVSRATKKYMLPKAAVRVNPAELPYNMPGYKVRAHGRAPRPDYIPYEGGEPIKLPLRAIGPAGITSQANFEAGAAPIFKDLNIAGRNPSIVRRFNEEREGNRKTFGSLNRYTPHGAILPGSPHVMNSLGEAVTGQTFTPEMKQINNAMINAHEYDEIMARGGPGMTVAGHRSPEVILREHNRVVTLPEKYKPVGDFYRIERDRGGENNVFKQHGLEFGQGERLNRRQRRFYTEEMNKTKTEEIRKMLDAQHPVLVRKKKKKISY